MAAKASSSVGKAVKLTIREKDPTGATVGASRSQAQSLTSSLTGLTVSHALIASGDSLRVQVQQNSPINGNSFYARSFSLAKTATPAQITYTHDCTLSETRVTQGDTVTAQATIKNTGGTSITLPNMILAGRPPGGTNGGGPFDDFSPTGTNITLTPGQSYTQNASRSFTTNDPTGGWYCFATYETQDGTWHDDPTDTTFSVSAPSGGTFAGPLFAGNTVNGCGTCGVPHTVAELSVASDGVPATADVWEEDAHFVRTYDPSKGTPLGEYSNQDNPTGVAVDTTSLYWTSQQGGIHVAPRSTWMNPANTNLSWSNTSSTYTMLASGHILGGMTECGGSLYVIDRNASRVDKVPLNISGITASFPVPNRPREIACDREGDLWVLQDTATPSVSRYTTSGALLTSFPLPGFSRYIAADPSSDHLWVADNGPGQNFKQLDYSGNQTGQLGVTGGYRADNGVVDSNHFVGPRAIAIDPAGEMFTVESGDPGSGATQWNDQPHLHTNAAIITKFNADRTVAWRQFGSEWGGVGQPTADMSRFFTSHWEYKRDAKGNYTIPYAFTVDPFTNPTDPRLTAPRDAFGITSYTWDANGHRYLSTVDEDNGSGYTIYMQRANSEIFDPVKRFPLSGTDMFRDPSTGDVWVVNSPNIVHYAFTGYDAQGVPQFAAAVTYSMPPAFSGGRIRRIEVHGTNVYISGFFASDPNPNNDFDGWKSMGRHLVKYSALPTRSGWPSPAWQIGPLYSGSGSSRLFPYTVSFTANDIGQVGVAWLEQPNTPPNGAQLDIRSASDGSLIKSIYPLVPGSQTGDDDDFRSLNARGSWFISEDDWYTRNVMLCADPSGKCS